MRKASQAVRYHWWFFLLMALVAMTELGLTAFLINAGNEHDTWPSPRYHKLLLLFCFNSAWTTMFCTAYILWLVDGAVHLLASIVSSIAWLLVNTALWAVASGLMQHTRRGGNCAGVPAISRFVSDRLPPPPSWPELTHNNFNPTLHHSCRQSLTVEALGWTELGLSALSLLATCFWARVGRKRRSFVSDSRRLV